MVSVAPGAPGNRQPYLSINGPVFFSEDKITILTLKKLISLNSRVRAILLMTLGAADATRWWPLVREVLGGLGPGGQELVEFVSGLDEQAARRSQAEEFPLLVERGHIQIPA
jgi:hypothetical protein